MKKRALVSVSDKTGLIPFVSFLVEAGFEIVSTGGTKKALEEAGLKVIGIEEVTGFPEILDGRVKTLHPYVHAGILATAEAAHQNTLHDMNISPIDLVVVNLYPFRQTVAKADVTLAEAIENIDIGGPSMIRAAAKNHGRAAVVVRPKDYEEVQRELAEAGTLSDDTRRLLSLRAFEHTAAYDAYIANWLRRRYDLTDYPDEWSMGGQKIADMRYGENPHQSAAFYMAAGGKGTVAGAVQLNGKPLSYNNIVDVDAAWALVNEWSEDTACAIIKHTNPCGLALGDSVKEAYEKALAADPVSAFGGIVALNQAVDGAAAQKMGEIFLEAIIAPEFSDEALTILKKKENLRLLSTGSQRVDHGEPVVKVVSGGFVIQEGDHRAVERSGCTCPTKREPTEAEWQDLLFAWKAVKHVKSNAIVVAKDGATLGVGAGQMNRVGSCRIAFEAAGSAAQGAVLASDAFFPFRDSVDLAKEAGISAIIQPGGSVRDEESIRAADEAGIAMIFTNVRHFKH